MLENPNSMPELKGKVKSLDDLFRIFGSLRNKEPKPKPKPKKGKK
jgi:hypothetical protein